MCADVQGYDASTGKHYLWYHLDEQTEWIDLAAEEKAGRVQWLPALLDPEEWPHPPPIRQAEPARPPPAPGATTPAPALPSVSCRPRLSFPRAVLIVLYGNALIVK